MIASIMLITVLSFITNIIGTVSGFGVGTVMTPILLEFMPFDQTIFFVCIIHWFHDVWKMIFFRKGIDWQLFAYFGIPTIIASFFGALLVTPAQSTLLTSLLGLFLLGSVGTIFFFPDLSLKKNWFNSTIGGLLSGFFAGIFGIRGAVRSVFMVAFDLKKAAFIGTTGVISLLLDSVRFGTYYIHGIRLPYFYYWGLIAFVPAAFFGVWIGKLIVGRIPQEKFRNVVAIFLLLVGVRLLLKPWL